MTTNGHEHSVMCVQFFSLFGCFTSLSRHDTSRWTAVLPLTTSSPSDPSPTTSTSKHLLLVEKSQAQTQATELLTKGGEVSSCAKRQHPISSGGEISIWIVSHFGFWERTGRSTCSLKRNSCKLQIGKPLWEAALPFVVSFLLSSECWHADVSSHSSCVITKTAERHEGVILYTRHCTAGGTPESGSRRRFKKRKLHSKGFSTSVLCRGCLLLHCFPYDFPTWHTG